MTSSNAGRRFDADLSLYLLAAELDTSDATAWMAQAACAGVAPDLFFPGRQESDVVRAAKQVCAVCPVIDDCLEYSLEHGEKFGVWGGRSERERRRMWGARMRAAS